MWRFILPGLIIVATLLVLLSGGLGLWQGAPPLSAVATHPVVASLEPKMEPPQSPPPVRPSPPLQPTQPVPPPSAVQPSPSVQPQAMPQVTAANPLQPRVDALQAQIERRTQQLASLHAQTDQAKRQFAAIQQQQQSVAASVDEQSKDLASLRAQIQAAQQQLDALRQQGQSAAASVKQHNDELAAVRAQADQARQDLAKAQQQQQASTDAAQELATLHEQLAQADHEVASLKRQRQAQTQSLADAKSQQQTATSVPATPPVQPETAMAPTSPPAPAASAQTQLTSAREQLAEGRPWAARRLLSVAQTQLAFQPVTPDQPIAQGGNMAATWVGEAIHWIDLGDTAQAYQAIDRAIQLTPHAPDASYAATTSDRSAYPPGYDQRYYQQH
jgi:hypothetical protein